MVSSSSIAGRVCVSPDSQLYFQDFSRAFPLLLSQLSPGFSLAEGGGWGTGLGFGFWDRLGRVFGGSGGGLGRGWGGVDTGGYGEDMGVDMDMDMDMDMGGYGRGDLGAGFGLSVLRMASPITHRG